MTALQANLTQVANVLASGRFTAEAAANVATLVKLGVDALLANGATEEQVAAQVFPLANRAVAQLRQMAVAH